MKLIVFQLLALLGPQHIHVVGADSPSFTTFVSESSSASKKTNAGKEGRILLQARKHQNRRLNNKEITGLKIDNSRILIGEPNEPQHSLVVNTEEYEKNSNGTLVPSVAVVKYRVKNPPKEFSFSFDLNPEWSLVGQPAYSASFTVVPKSSTVSVKKKEDSNIEDFWISVKLEKRPPSSDSSGSDQSQSIIEIKYIDLEKNLDGHKVTVSNQDLKPKNVLISEGVVRKSIDVGYFIYNPPTEFTVTLTGVSTWNIADKVEDFQLKAYHNYNTTCSDTPDTPDVLQCTFTFDEDNKGEWNPKQSWFFKDGYDRQFLWWLRLVKKVAEPASTISLTASTNEGVEFFSIEDFNIVTKNYVYRE